MGIFIDDQTLTPIYVRLLLDPDKDEVTWLECKVGERLVGKVGETGKHEMVRWPYSELNAKVKRLYRLNGNVDQIDWVYKVTFGERN